MTFALLASAVSLADVAYPAKCSVTLDANGGSVSRRSMNYSGKLGTLGTLPVPTRSGYAFKYWTMVRNDPSSRVSAKTDVWTVAEHGVKSGPNKGYTSKATLYAYWGVVPPKPSATDGKYASYVKVTWSAVPGAAWYKVRRATKPDYAKAKTIATTTKTTYKDRDAICQAKKKYYYWIVPYDRQDVGAKNVAAYDRGHAKLRFTVHGPSWVYVGETEPSEVWTSNPCLLLAQNACTWKITSGKSYASVDANGNVRGKKKGSAKMAITYDGLTVTLPIYVCEQDDLVPPLYNTGYADSK